MTREQALEEAREWTVKAVKTFEPDKALLYSEHALKAIDAALATPESVCRWFQDERRVHNGCWESFPIPNGLLNAAWACIEENIGIRFCPGCGARIEIVEGE